VGTDLKLDFNLRENVELWLPVLFPPSQDPLNHIIDISKNGREELERKHRNKQNEAVEEKSNDLCEKWEKKGNVEQVADGSDDHREKYVPETCNDVIEAEKIIQSNFNSPDRLEALNVMHSGMK